MHKKFEINRSKIKDGCQSGRKLVTHNSKSDLPLVEDLKIRQSLLTVLYSLPSLISKCYLSTYGPEFLHYNLEAGMFFDQLVEFESFINLFFLKPICLMTF